MYEIRRATLGDWGRIRELISLYPDKLVQDLLPECHEFFVAAKLGKVNRGKILGCAALQVYSPRFAEVRSVSVERRYKRKGIGKELVLSCVKEAEYQKIREVMAITSSPQTFEKYGFSTSLNERFAMFRRTNRSEE